MLFALTTQLVLAFGHVHRDGTPGIAGVTLAQQTVKDAGTLPDGPASPAAPAGAIFDYCAICAFISLTGSILPTVAPALPLPLVTSRISLTRRDEGILLPPSHLQFRARAPPAI